MLYSAYDVLSHFTVLSVTPKSPLRDCAVPPHKSIATWVGDEGLAVRIMYLLVAVVTSSVLVLISDYVLTSFML